MYFQTLDSTELPVLWTETISWGGDFGLFKTFALTFFVTIVTLFKVVSVCVSIVTPKFKSGQVWVPVVCLNFVLSIFRDGIPSFVLVWLLKIGCSSVIRFGLGLVDRWTTFLDKLSTLTIVLLKIMDNFRGNNLAKTFLGRLWDKSLSDLFLFHF